MKKRFVHLSPPQSLILVFAVAIFFGTLFLLLPVATEEDISFIDALFTATSAMTVTGLVVVDTGSVYTTFGESIIMVLIQVGGLGIMTFAVLIYMVLGKKIGIKERLLIKQAMNQTSIGGLIFLIKRLLIFSLSVELIAIVFLSLRWVPEMGWRDGIYTSVFHAVSAFNNAGFSIWSDSLSGYVTDPVVNIVISFLFIIGGIGFTVVFDLWNKKQFQHLSLHTKIMLVGTFSINVFSLIIIFVLEYNNPDTLADMSSSGKWLASYFQAVTPRTAGFNSIDIGQMEESSLFYIITLMFIGGGSASTAGGVKLSTALIILLATFAVFKEKDNVVLYHRSIRPFLVMRALALTIGSIGVIIVSVFVLNLTEDASFLTILFECVSAFGTVGLSMGLTGDLTLIGKVVLIMTMLIGKLGPLTFAFAFAKSTPDPVKYPHEDVMTG
ncbi:TrkH family potassium uptake protein [Halobacillus campisalis]|uniref:TrkH family potassium uptake protein n=1 Tax=Halobacillus campisalis TaxID=435909 RepID=A0ABW2K685_9BACI|nr:TrkH family potassium uptake protein [Halobacillus campisalis]